jgi:hypothetical protein
MRRGLSRFVDGGPFPHAAGELFGLDMGGKINRLTQGGQVVN